MAVDNIILAPESFRTIYLRKEDRIILRTEQGRKIIIKRIIPSEWKPWKIYDQETAMNDNKKEIESANCNFFFMDNEEKLCNFTAEQLSQQKVIGWFQGNMEWGPRALGNRSIISDPRNSDIKNILNLKIKRRLKYILTNLKYRFRFLLTVFVIELSLILYTPYFSLK